jgi:hypothetical protein
MAKSIVEKVGISDHKKFIPQSTDTDHGKKSSTPSGVKKAAGIFAGTWALNKLGGGTLFGLFVLGLAVGYAWKKGYVKNFLPRESA